MVHTASPFTDNPRTQEELVRPAVEGTLAVMRACHKHEVKRVVITSSIAAIIEGHPEQPEVLDESVWSVVENLNTLQKAYSRSKTLAEREAWDFQKALPPSEQFELVTINPALVFGPALIGATGFSSGELIKTVMEGALPGMPIIQVPLVDVRECAQAHLNAVKVAEARNQRFILCNRSVWFREIGQALHNEFSTKGWNFNHTEMCYCTICMAACFNAKAAQMKRYWGLQI